MKEIILIKNGEIALKGSNRHIFENVLIKNIKWRLKKMGKFSVTKAQSTIIVDPLDEHIDFDEVCDAIGKVFGIATYSRCLVTEKDLTVIQNDAKEYVKEILPYAKSFKVAAKRADKHFPFKSPQIQYEVGGFLSEAYPNCKVDVHNPEVTVTVEVRDTNAYIHANIFKGAGGMPITTSGKALLLLSGGIDSPVAAYLMARRGMKVSAIHFSSPPYTSERALKKVTDLAEKLVPHIGDITFYNANFTKLQEAIKDNCPEDIFTLVMRRLMMKVACRIAKREDIPAIITGESLGQVASQTVQALNVTDCCSDRVVLRPLIGLDKTNIIEISRHIDTYETSILPYEDCCTVFTPRHPDTRPVLCEIEKAESKFDFEPLIQECVDNIVESVIKL
ncbi:MAG: tRNA uracil 4-sulfurtransferase ThiI [Oscillospiraceae bacterium]